MGRNGTMEENKEKSRLCRNRAAHKDVGEGGGKKGSGETQEVNGGERGGGNCVEDRCGKKYNSTRRGSHMEPA